MVVGVRPEAFVDQAHVDRMRFYASREWHVLRQGVIDRAGGICERCHLRKVREIDHKTYERFGGRELLSDLQGLCGPCHDCKHNLLAEGLDPAPSWAGFYGSVMRQYGLLRELEPSPSVALGKKLEHLQKALAGSPGEEFLLTLGIPLEIAQRFQLGFVRPSPEEIELEGRLVFPGMNPIGEVITLMGRAIPKDGRLGTASLWTGEGSGIGYVGAEVLGFRCNAIVCNNAFEALALAAAGAERVMAAAGSAWRWPWAIPLRHITLSFDPMEVGGGWERIGYEAEMMNLPLAVVAPNEGQADYATLWAEGERDQVKAAVRNMEAY